MISPVMQEEAPEIYLTEQERHLVREQRARLHGPLRNGEFPSIVLRPRGDGEVDVVYAFSRRVRVSRDCYRVEVCAAAMTSSDADRIAYRNLRLMARGGYRVDDWGAGMDGPSWGYEPTRTDGTGEIPGPVANPDALAATRYRYAGLDERCWGIRPAQYLRLLRAHPLAELLHKAELDQLITPAILKRRDARELARFIARNAAAIREEDAGCAAVTTAYRCGCSIREAVLRVRARTKMLGVPLPEGLDAVAALLYCDKAGIEVWEYRRHAEHCRELNLGASAWTPAPKRFRDFAEEVERRLAEGRRRREAAAAKRQDAKLAARAAELAALAVRGPRGVVLLYPDSRKSLEAEGAAMHNCIGNGLYAQEMARGASVCVFIRRTEAPDKPFCDAELSRKNGVWRVRQCYARGNQSAPDEAMKAAHKLCAALNKTETTATKKGA